MQAVLEILGPCDFSSVSLKPGVPLDLAGSHLELEKVAGSLACRGFEDRIGQALFRGFLRKAAEPLGFFKPEILYQPVRKKALIGLRLICAEYERLTGVDIQIKEQAARFQLILPVSRDSHQSCPLPCPILVGFLKEFMSWCGGGRHFLVEETSCLTAGNTACSFSIHTTPLD